MRKKALREATAVAWIVLFSGLAPAQSQDQSVMAAHDARALLRAVSVGSAPVRLPLNAALDADPAEDEAPEISDLRALDEDHLLEFLRAAVAEHDSELSILGGRLIVKGPPAVQQTVAALLFQLSAMVLQGAVVEAYALAANDQTPVGVVPPAEAERMLSDRAAPVLIGRISVVLGQPGRLRAGRDVSFVCDYDVEVAEDAAIADPVIRVLHEGLDLQASIGVALDGRILARCAWSRAALAEPLSTRAVESARVGNLQLPKVLSTIAAASGLIEDAGALVVRHDGGAGTATMIRVRRTGPAAPPPEGRGHRVIHASELLTGPVRIAIPDVRGRVQTWHGHPGDGGLKRDSGPQLPEDGPDHGADGAFHDLVLAGIEGDLRSEAWIVRSRLHLVGDETKVARIRAALGALSKDASRTVAVEFRLGRVQGVSQALVADVEALAARAGTMAAVTAASSDQFLIGGGLEQAAIVDHDAEIAQKVVIADPQVAPLFSGYVISGTVAPAGADRMELVCDVQQQEVADLTKGGLPLRADNVGPVDLPQIELAGGRFRALLDPGRWSLVAVSNATEAGAFVVLARARWQ